MENKKFKVMKFCWICSKRFYGNKKYLILGEDGEEHLVHKTCAQEHNYQILEKEKMTMVKIFITGTCVKCEEAKQLNDKLNKMGIKSTLYDTETAEGLAECTFYGVTTIPSVLFKAKNGDLVGWRGCIPDSASEIIKRL